ncbi:MAG: hypothetical protein HQ534_10390 [Armatimonadetes bacterium]|nr:hypothetical protein [Armatimonadota bacterium]
MSKIGILAFKRFHYNKTFVIRCSITFGGGEPIFYSRLLYEVIASGRADVLDEDEALIKAGLTRPIIVSTTESIGMYGFVRKADMLI